MQVQHSFLRVKWMKTRSEDLVFIESVLESVIDEMRMRGFSDRRYSLGISIVKIQYEVLTNHLWSTYIDVHGR